MPTNFILGSGVISLIARAVLGDNWTLIPFNKSRFYSFNPPLADDYITYSSEANLILSQLNLPINTVHYQRATSLCGQLIFSDESFVKQLYIEKLFNGAQHPAALQLLRNESIIYSLSVRHIYDQLLMRFTPEIHKSIEQYGELCQITDHTIVTTKGSYEFESMISTIPLYALNKFLGFSDDITGRDVWYYHVNTPSLDFEGAKQVFVADKVYDFFRVTTVAPEHYLFECLCDIMQPFEYFGAFTNNKLNVINSTRLEKVIPLDTPPKLDVMENKAIYPIGRHAQWDEFMDIGASMRRLSKLVNKLT